VTVRVFLRELRGRWPGADPPLDERAAWAASHLGILGDRPSLRALRTLAGSAGVDVRDLEAALVRAALAHRRAATCPGGDACFLRRARRTPAASPARR